MVKLPGLGGLPKRYPKTPTKYIQGKSYWGYKYVSTPENTEYASGSDLVHKFIAKGRPTVSFSNQGIGTGVFERESIHSNPRHILSIISKYPKKLLVGVGEIRSGGREINVKFGNTNASDITGLYTPKTGSQPATIDIAAPHKEGLINPNTLAHEIAHHIDETQNKHQQLLWHLPTNRSIRDKNWIGGPTMHADRNASEDFAETVAIMQTEGKQGLDRAYKMKSLQMRAMPHTYNIPEKPSNYQLEEAKSARKKLFDFVVGRYGVPKRVKASDPTIPKAYRAPEQLSEDYPLYRFDPIKEESSPTYDNRPSPLLPSIQPYETDAHKQAAEVKTKVYPVPKEYSNEVTDKDIPIEKPGAIKPWASVPKETKIYSVRAKGAPSKPSDTYQGIGRSTGYFGSGIYGFNEYSKARAEAEKHGKEVYEVNAKKPLVLEDKRIGFTSEQPAALVHDASKELVWEQYKISKGEQDDETIKVKSQRLADDVSFATGVKFSPAEVEKVIRSKPSELQPINQLLKKKGIDAVITPNAKNRYGEEFQGWAYGSVVLGHPKVKKVDEASQLDTKVPKETSPLNPMKVPFAVPEELRPKEEIKITKRPGEIKPFVKVDYPYPSYHVSASPKVTLKEGHNIKAGRSIYGPRKGFYVGNDPATWMDVLEKERVTDKEGKTYIYPVDMSRLNKEEVTDTTGIGFKALNQALAIRRGQEIGIDKSNPELFKRVTTPVQEQKIEPGALKKVTLGEPIVVKGDFGNYWEGYTSKDWKTREWGADVDLEIEASQIADRTPKEIGPLNPTKTPKSETGAYGLFVVPEGAKGFKDQPPEPIFTGKTFKSSKEAETYSGIETVAGQGEVYSIKELNPKDEGRYPRKSSSDTRPYVVEYERPYFDTPSKIRTSININKTSSVPTEYFGWHPISMPIKGAEAIAQTTFIRKGQQRERSPALIIGPNKDEYYAKRLEKAKEEAGKSWDEAEAKNKEYRAKGEKTRYMINTDDFSREHYIDVSTRRYKPGSKADLIGALAMTDTLFETHQGPGTGEKIYVPRFTTKLKDSFPPGDPRFTRKAGHSNWSGITLFRTRGDGKIEHIPIHEVAHQIHNALPHSEKSNWLAISNTPASPEAPSVYASKNASEDFAESYVAFMGGKTLDIHRQQFMKSIASKYDLPTKEKFEEQFKVPVEYRPKDEIQLPEVSREVPSNHILSSPFLVDKHPGAGPYPASDEKTGLYSQVKPRAVAQDLSWQQAYYENRTKEAESRKKYSFEPKLTPQPGGYPIRPGTMEMDVDNSLARSIARKHMIERRVDSGVSLERATDMVDTEMSNIRPQSQVRKIEVSDLLVERPVKAEAQPEGPSRITNEPFTSPYMTKEARREIQALNEPYESEIEAEAESLESNEPVVLRKAEPREKKESQDASDEDILESLYGD